MAEETLQCPSCNQKVRAPQELLGQPVQCPLCRQIFTAPVRSSSTPGTPPSVIGIQPQGQPPGQYITPPAMGQAPYPPGQYMTPPAPGSEDDRARAVALVRWPATFMVIIGGLGLAYQLVEVLRLRSMGMDGLEKQLAEQRAVYESFGMNQATPSAEFMYTLMLVAFGVGSVVRLMMVFAGVQMLRLRGYGMSLVGSLAALLPLFDCPCCVFSPMIAIWSLVVLFQPAVRNSFE